MLLLFQKKCRVFKFPRTDDKETVPEDIPLTFIKNAHSFDIEDMKLTAYQTPGHTTDSLILHLEVCKYFLNHWGEVLWAKSEQNFQQEKCKLFVRIFQEENAVFSADTILGEGTAVFEDLHDYMISLETILALKPSVIYPGHGPVINVCTSSRNVSIFVYLNYLIFIFQDPIERIEFYIEHRNQREQQILAAMSSKSKKAWTPMDVVKIVYTVHTVYAESQSQEF